MSFGPSGTTKTAENNLGGISSTAVNTLFPQVTTAGGNMLGQGAADVTSGTNFLNTLLNGNKANTTAMLQPSIDDIRKANTNTLGAISTLTPRGGGRSSALFGQSFSPTQQIQNLFNTGRTAAATSLPQIGLGQEGVGTNLFNIGTGALNAGTGASSNLGSMGLQSQQISNSLFSGLGSGIMGLLGMPVDSSGTSLFGKILYPNG